MNFSSGFIFMVCGLWGLLMGHFTIRKLTKSAERIGRDWLQLRSNIALRRRAKFLLRFPIVIPFFPFAWPIFCFSGLMFMAEYLGSFLPAIFFATGCLIFWFLLEVELNAKIHHYKLIVPIVAAKKLATNSPPAESAEFMRQLSAEHDFRSRVAAINGFMELEPEVGLPALDRMRHDENRVVANAAREAFDALFKAVDSKNALRLTDMENLLVQHDVLARQTKSNPTMKQALSEIVTQIDEIVYSQLQQRTAYPHVYCRNCLSRAEQLKHGEWTWVRCLHCHEAFALVTDVRFVTGIIGTEEAWTLTNGDLRVSLWDETTRKALAADVAELEVIGGKSISYDWAVNAVVQKLRILDNQKVRVRLLHRPELDRNSMLLLKGLDPMMEEKL